MKKLVKNQFNGRVSLLSIATAVMMFPVAAMAEEAGDDNAAERGRRGDEIIVTARSLSRPDMPTATPVQVLSGDELAHRRQGGLGETLAGLPGVHLDNFGGGASRPVIRGQTLPRIEILSDGANLFDVSSVSPDHAITTDPLLLDAIEILRGPGATRYGGNAASGAINVIDSKVPKALPEGGLTGATEVRYGTGDEEKTVVGRVTAGFGQFAIHADGARRAAEDYAVPGSYGTERLRDSFAESTSYAIGASWVTSKGYLGAAYTRVENQYGLPGHSHANGVCHLHGYPFPAPGRIDLHCVGHGQYQNPLTNPDSDTASIDLRSDRFDVRGDYVDLLPGITNLRIRGSYTDYRHDEIDGPILYSRYNNEVWDGRLELTHKPLFGFTGTLGAQYTKGTFSGLNLIALHLPPSGNVGFEGAPRYLTDNIGVFLSERRSFGPIDVEVSARKDWRTINVPIPGPFYASPTPARQAYYERTYGADWRKTLESTQRSIFAAQNPQRKHEPFSASIGATWKVRDGYSIALSLAHTERAPNMREMFADGSNLATNSYEVGLLASAFVQNYLSDELFSDVDIMEKFRSVNLTFRKVGGPLEVEIGAFYQRVDNYIFAHLLESEFATGARHNFLLYTAADAELYGVDGQISYQLAPASRIKVFGDFVDTNLRNDGDNLPRIPPGRLGARYEHKAGPLSGDLEYSHTFGQDKVASYETPTSGYDMLNVTLSYRFDLGQTKAVEFYVRGTNLLNELAFAHTSFVKDQSPLRGRSVALGMRHQF